MSSQRRGKELINGRLRRTPVPFRNVLKALNLNVPDEIVTIDYQVHYFLFRTMTNKCTIISQIITLLHVSTLSCHPQGACNQYLAKLHNYFKCSCWQYNLKLR